MKITEAQPSDIDRIYELILQLAKNEDMLDQVKVSKQELNSLIFNKDSILKCICARLNNEIIGIAIYYFKASTWKGKTMHLEDIIVDENMRGKGVGKLFFQHLKELGHKNQVKRIEWEVAVDNIASQNFYKNIGASFANDWTICRLDL